MNAPPHTHSDDVARKLTESDREMEKQFVRLSAKVDSLVRKTDRMWAWMRLLVGSIVGLTGTVIAAGVTLLLALT